MQISVTTLGKLPMTHMIFCGKNGTEPSQKHKSYGSITPKANWPVKGDGMSMIMTIISKGRTTRTMTTKRVEGVGPT